MRLVTAPDKLPALGFLEHLGVMTVFVGGSIEMGAAREWQAEVIERYRDVEDLLLLNPRRTQWNPTWTQDPSNAELKQQIQWELNGIEKADTVLLYFQAGTMSPITLLELGICLGSGKLTIVVCEEGFHREANVHWTCDYFGVEVFKTLEAGLAVLDEALT